MQIDNMASDQQRWLDAHQAKPSISRVWSLQDPADSRPPQWSA